MNLIALSLMAVCTGPTYLCGYSPKGYIVLSYFGVASLIRCTPDQVHMFSVLVLGK